MKILLVITLFTLNSCALVTTPVKVVGSAATTTMSLTGKAIGAGIDQFGDDEEGQ